MDSRNLERDIFGGSDSELSSDEEEEIVQKRPPQQTSRRERDDYDQESSDESGLDGEGDGGEDYRDSRPSGTAVGKSSRKKKSRRTAVGEGEEDEEGGGRRRRGEGRGTKRKRKVMDEEELNELPPEIASKIRLDMQIEAALKVRKAKPRKRKKNDADEEVLDRFADEEVSRLREGMLNAAEADADANKQKLPATNKLKLLPQVMDVLRKASLAQSIIDNNLLEGVRRWLEPLPDRSLPGLNIQRDFFPILRKMEFIDSAVLKESGLGRIILFYTKCKRVTPDIARIAHDLVSIWSRPIIKRSASYRDRVVPVAQEGDGGEGASQRPGGERLNAILARAKESEKHRVRKNAVMIPQRELGSYTVAPRAGAGMAGRVNASVEEDVERRKRQADRLRALTRKGANK